MTHDAELHHNCIDQRRCWSAEVGRTSHALDLEPGVFTWHDPADIASSLWRSAQRSERRQRSVYGSAMAMLCFYINRAGVKLTPARRQLLERAKMELRRLAAESRR